MDAHFDLVGQVIEENETLNNTALGRLRMKVNNTLNQESMISMAHDVKGGPTASIMTKTKKNVRMLFLDKRHSPTFVMLAIMFTCSLNLYYLGLFSSAELKGDAFTIGICFGLAETFGILLGERMLEHLPEHISMYISLACILIPCNIISMVEDLDENYLYILFLI